LEETTGRRSLASTAKIASARWYDQDSLALHGVLNPAGALRCSEIVGLDWLIRGDGTGHVSIDDGHRYRPDDVEGLPGRGRADRHSESLNRDWVRACTNLGLPQVMSHALRHTHVSALIAANVDVVQHRRSGCHRDRGGNENDAGTMIVVIRTVIRALGANSGFVRWDGYAKCLTRLYGDVAEWLKAAVC
jgi:hypothetical protein